jgi:hypothetical protein
MQRHPCSGRGDSPKAPSSAVLRETPAVAA